MDPLDLLRADPWAALLTASVLKGALLLAAALLATRALRRASAATRHLVWTLAFAAVLLMPVLLAVVPGWEVPVLPADAFGLLDTAPVAGGLSAVAEAGPAASGGVSAEALLLGLWALGALLVGVRWLVAAAAAAVFTRHAAPLTDPAWRLLAEEVQRTLGLRRPVSLRMSRHLRAPMSWGVRRPVVLLPVEAGAWTAERRRVVLTHELAHVRRRDSLTQWLGQAVVALHWFNPLAWRGYRRMLVEREHACDDLVLRDGALPSVYAGHLLQIARDLGRAPRAELAMASMARPSQIEERLRSILNGRQRRDALSRGLLVIVGVLVLALVWPVVAIDPVAAPAPAPRPPVPPVSPLPPAAAAPALALLPPAPPLPPVPPPAAAPEVEPLPAPRPEPLSVVESETRRLVVEVADPFSDPSGPSAPAAFAVRVRADESGASQTPAETVEGERCRTRLDAALAVEMTASERTVRVDVSRLLDDAAAWDALEQRAEALAERMAALTRRAERWEAMAWVEHEALADSERFAAPNFDVDVAVDWKREVDNIGRPTYRPGRRVSEECPDSARQKAPASW